MTLAAAGAATLAGVLNQSLGVVPIAFVVALPHAATGLVAFFLLRSRGRVTLFSSLVVGFLVGAIPLSIFTGLALPDSASTGGVSTVVDGRLTWAGWIEHLIFAVMLGSYGAVAGLIFWLAVRTSPQAIGGGAVADPSPGLGASRFALPLTLAIAAIFGIFSIPSVTLDRTCHNPLRDGRTFIESEIGINLRVGMSEWKDVAAILEDFGRSIGWSVRNDIRNVPGMIYSLYGSVCEDAGTEIMMNEMFFPGDPITAIGDRLAISVYQPQGGESWKDPTKKLVERLSKRWPGRVWFSGGQGEEIPPPEWIKSALTQ
ncbi:MAG: hypothetical protein H7X89_16110 [Rhizobiales bacterium]|nr:hypothetical protein [Hyphomicrobiales bacterium]